MSNQVYERTTNIMIITHTHTILESSNLLFIHSHSVSAICSVNISSTKSTCLRSLLTFPSPSSTNPGVQDLDHSLLNNNDNNKSLL